MELGNQADVEYPAHDTHIIGRRAGKRNIGLTEAWVEEEALREDTVLSQFVGEIIAHGQSGGAVGVVVKERNRWRRGIGFHQVREAFVRVVDAGKKIKSRVGSLDRVEANTASENVAEIKTLQ